MANKKEKDKRVKIIIYTLLKIISHPTQIILQKQN